MNQNMFQMDMISKRGLLLSLLRNLWMVVLAGATVWLAVTGVHNLTYKPEYTSSATLVVTVQGSTSAYSSLSVTSSMADVFGQVFQSAALRDRIIEDVGEEIEGTVSCSPISETNLLVLSTTSPDLSIQLCSIMRMWRARSFPTRLCRFCRSRRCPPLPPIRPGSWPDVIC